MQNKIKGVNAEGNENSSVILYDGVCVLCSKVVRFLIRHDTKDIFRFAALQSEPGKRLLSGHSGPSGTGDSVVFIENGKAYFRSTAVLRILRKLPGGWPLLYILILVPAPVRDFFYTFVARKRYGWFGKYDECQIPDDNIRTKFIDRPYREI